MIRVPSTERLRTPSTEQKPSNSLPNGVKGLKGSKPTLVDTSSSPELPAAKPMSLEDRSVEMKASGALEDRTVYMGDVRVEMSSSPLKLPDTVDLTVDLEGGGEEDDMKLSQSSATDSSNNDTLEEPNSPPIIKPTKKNLSLSVVTSSATSKTTETVTAISPAKSGTARRRGRRHTTAELQVRSLRERTMRSMVTCRFRSLACSVSARFYPSRSYSLTTLHHTDFHQDRRGTRHRYVRKSGEEPEGS